MRTAAASWRFAYYSRLRVRARRADVEFAAAGHDLDRWLSTKLAQTALPERLLAPLSALRSLKSGMALDASSPVS